MKMESVVNRRMVRNTAWCWDTRDGQSTNVRANNETRAFQSHSGGRDSIFDLRVDRGGLSRDAGESWKFRGGVGERMEPGSLEVGLVSSRI